MTAKPTRKHLAQLLVSLFSQQRELLRQKIDDANAAHASAGAAVGPPLPVVHAVPAAGPLARTPASSAGPGLPSASPTSVPARARPLLVLLAAAVVLGALFGALAVATRGSSRASNPIRGVPAEAAPLPPVQAESAPSSTAPLPSPAALPGGGHGEAPALARDTNDVPEAGAAPPRRRVLPRPKGDSPDLGY
jgi:hypothetical protein